MGKYVDRSNAVIRWLLVTANFVILVLCLSVVSVGVWTIGFKSFISGLLTDRLFLSCAYLQVVAGLLCLANSLFGFYSCYKEVKSLLVVHLAVSILMLTVMVMGGVMAYVFRHQIELNMKSQLMSDLRVYTPHHHNDPTTATGVTLAWDRTQSLLHCCGIKTVQVEYPWQIWAYNAGVNPVVSPDSSQVQVPASCCVSNTNCSSSNPASIWPDDCYHKGVEYLQDHSAIMGSVTLAAAITMVFGIFFSILLLKRIR